MAETEENSKQNFNLIKNINYSTYMKSEEFLEQKQINLKIRAIENKEATTEN